MTEIENLISRWEREASELRTRYGLEHIAQTCISHAEELKEAIDREKNAMLSIDEAEAWTGYSKSHLRRLVRDGKLNEYGSGSSARFRKAELPVKAEAGLPIKAEPKKKVPSIKQLSEKDKKRIDQIMKRK